MTYHRETIGNCIYLRATFKTRQSAEYATRERGFIVGCYNTGWICYIPLKGQGHA